MNRIATTMICTISILASASAASACGGKDILTTASDAGQFKTLATAIEAAGLTPALKGEGPFTVFAPTDEAFAKLPAGTVESLIGKPEQLKAILLNHVVAGEVLAKDVAKLASAKTLLGQSVEIGTCSSVKVIDSVILPKNDILEAARNAGSFSTLLTAIDAAGLSEALRGDGPFTVFAPTDEAFAKLPAGTIEGLLQDKSTLKSILTYHVVPGKVLAGDVAKLHEAETLQGSRIKIDTSHGVMVDGAKVIMTDIMTSNGVIHVIALRKALGERSWALHLSQRWKRARGGRDGVAVPLALFHEQKGRPRRMRRAMETKMKIHKLKSDVVVPCDRQTVFEFFSDAENLDAITPPWLRFRIVDPPQRMAVATLIDYRLRLRGVPINWQSEITVWEPPVRFVDQQRSGPYLMWVHEHSFQALPGATRIVDQVAYVVPGGVFEPFLHWAFVQRDLHSIFSYRSERIRELLPLIRKPNAESFANSEVA
jgi:uncharacterized surface protein with fasciclin (FAS1) repeats/ligand-binding SRPBCC domain-containing protein